MDDLDRVRLGLPTLETTGGNSGWSVAGDALSAFRNLARSRNVDIGYVLAKASEGRLRDVIELRAVGKAVSPSRPGWGTRDPERVLEILSFKRKLWY